MNRVATAPISWGVCEVPGWGHQMSPDRVLAEMSALGFTHTELGSAGWLPTSAAALSDTLDRHNLSLLAAFVPLVLHDESQAEAALEQASQAARLLADTNAPYFNTAAVTSTDWEPRSPLTDDQWRHLFDMIARVDTLCSDFGLTQVVHEHVGCVIETADEVRALLANTEAKLVLDTGHLAIGGFPPIEVVTDHIDRIGLVHLKDTRVAVAERLNRGELTLMEAVQAGLFTALGRGDLDMADIVTTLEANGYEGWYVIEQDCAIGGDAPSPGEGPQRDVAVSRDFVAALAAGSAARDDG